MYYLLHTSFPLSMNLNVESKCIFSICHLTFFSKANIFYSLYNNTNHDRNNLTNIWQYGRKDCGRIGSVA